MTALHSAAAAGDVAAARALLAAPNGPDVNAFDLAGYTPLHLAVRGAHLAVAELLLEHRALASLKSPYGEGGANDFVSALELAALEENWEMVKLIVSRKPKMANHTLSRSNESLLGRAYKSADGLSHVPWLIQHGARCPKLLPSLARTGKMEAVRELLQMGADPSSPDLLCECARHCDASTLVWLLDQGASADVPELLEEVVFKEDWPMLRMLLRRGANPGHPRVLAALADRGLTEQLEMLLRLGASPNHPSVLVAAAKRDTRVLFWLLDQGASADCPQLLLTVAEEGKERTLRDLISRGANPNVPGLLTAVARRRWTCTLFDLCDRGADLSDVPGLLATVAEWGETSSLYKLLDRGASPDCPDLLLTVAERGDWATFEALLERGALAATRAPALLAAVAEQCRGDVLVKLLARGAPGDAPAMLRALAATGQRAVLASLLEQGVDLAPAAPGLVSDAIEGAAYAGQPCEIQLLNLLLGQGGFGAEAIDWECALDRPNPFPPAPAANLWQQYSDGPSLSAATEEAGGFLRQLPGRRARCSSSSAASYVRRDAAEELQRSQRTLQSLLGQAARNQPHRPEFAAPWQRAFAAARWVLPAVLGRAYWRVVRRPMPTLDEDGSMAEDVRRLAPFWHQSPLWAAINCCDVGAVRLLLSFLEVAAPAAPGLTGIRFVDLAIQQGAPVRPWDCPFYQLLVRHQACWECDQSSWTIADLAAAGVAEALLAAGARPLDCDGLLRIAVPSGGQLGGPKCRRFMGFERSALLCVLRLSGSPWSRATHAAFPPRFRAAVRCLLLAAHRGVPAGPQNRAPSLPASPSQHAGQGVAAGLGKGSGRGGGGVSLPEELVELVVGHMAAQLLPWLDAAPAQPPHEHDPFWRLRLQCSGAAGETLLPRLPGEEWPDMLPELLAGQAPHWPGDVY